MNAQDLLMQFLYEQLAVLMNCTDCSSFDICTFSGMDGGSSYQGLCLSSYKIFLWFTIKSRYKLYSGHLYSLQVMFSSGFFFSFELAIIAYLSLGFAVEIHTILI